VDYRASTRSRSQLQWRKLNVAALERSDNVADRDHAFAMLKRGYPGRAVMVPKREMRPHRRTVRKKASGRRYYRSGKVRRNFSDSQSE